MDTNTSKQESVDEMLRQAFEQWQQHPTTRQVIRNVSKHREAFVLWVSQHLHDPDVTDASFRCHTAGIATCDKLLKMMTDFTEFNKFVKNYAA